MSDKRKIDSDVEAQALASMLKNTAGDLNSTDIEYIKKVLTESGYGAYIPKEDTKAEEQTGPKQEEKPVVQDAKTETPEAPKKQKAENNTGTAKDTPQQTEKPATEAPKTEQKEEPGTPSQNEKEVKGASSNKVISDKPEIKQKEINKPTTNPPKAKAQKKYQITEVGRNKGLKLAHEVKEELAARVTDNERLVGLLKSVNTGSAYNFVGQFANMRGPQLNQQVFSISDIFDKIDYNATLHVMKKLLEQAKAFGLAGTPAYNNLQRVITTGETNLKNRTLDDGDPNERTQVEADRAISLLYNEMSKVIK